MRILLAELAPARGDVGANLDRIEAIVGAADVDLAVFPELYLAGYLVGDRVHQLAIARDGPEVGRLAALARRTERAIVVGAPLRHPGRSGEVENAALLIDGKGHLAVQVKRFLPSFGPFEESHFFTPTRASSPLPLGPHRLGLEICYDAFFPEVTRELAMAGADLLINISASPVTSRTLFERVLPARAVENSVPLVYVNRVGVEDGIVFGGGSGAWDARGAVRELRPLSLPTREEEERIGVVELDLSEGHRHRPFRPVLRDLSVAPPGPIPLERNEGRGPPRAESPVDSPARFTSAGPTDRL